MINYNTVYDGVYDIVSPLVSPLPLIRDYQSEIKPNEKYITYRLIDFRPIGFQQQYATETDGSFEIHQTYSLTIRFNVIGKESSGDASALHVKLQRPSVRDSFSQLDLHFYDRTLVRDVPKLMSTGFEDRSTFDFKFYTRVTDIDIQGWIEFVELQEKYLHPDGDVIVDSTTIIDLVP